jgi:hypothetical protein
MPRDFKNMLKSTNDEHVSEAENFIYSFATKYDDFNNHWLYFESFLQSINYTVDNYEGFIRRSDFIEFSTESNIHLIAIKAFHLTGENAPIEFVSPRIRSMIINNKKLDFLREIKDSLYNNALKYNKFRVFN